MKLIIALIVALSTVNAFARNTNTKKNEPGPQTHVCAISLGELHALVNSHPSFKGKFASNIAGLFAGRWLNEEGEYRFSIPAKGKIEIYGIDVKICPQPNGTLYGETSMGSGYLKITEGGEAMRLHKTSTGLTMAAGKYYREGSSVATKLKKRAGPLQ